MNIESGVVDWKAIEAIESLKVLRTWENLGTKIDYTKLPNLEELWVHGSDKFINSVYELENLEYLRIAGWKELDFSKLAKLKNLKHLELVDSRKLESLEGASKLKNLKNCELMCCSKLINIDELNNCPNLNYLKISGCHRIEYPASFKGLTNLQKLRLGMNKKFQSLLPFAECKNLEFLQVVEMRIEDGKLGFIKELPNLKAIRIQPKRHYDIDVNVFEEVLRDKYGDYQ